MAGAPLYEQPCARVLRFLRDEFSDGPFKAFYDGDPDLLPTFNLPAISVVKSSDTMTNGPTGMKRITEQLIVKVILNKQDDWTGNHEVTDFTEKRIRDLVEARDEGTGSYLPNTIKYALMNRFEMEGAALDNNMSFALGIVQRPDELYTQEGHLTITIGYLVPNRPD